MGSASVLDYVNIEASTEALHEMLLQKYRNKIEATEYDFSAYKDYLENTFDCEEVELTASEKYVFKYNFEMNTPVHSNDINLISFHILENEKSSALYKNLFCYEKIIVTIESNTGYIDTNSVELFEALTLIKGVTQEDVEKETNTYKDYLLCLYKKESNNGDKE